MEPDLDANPSQWTDPEFLATALARIGYEPTAWRATDHVLVRIAGMGYEPALLLDRVRAACTNAHCSIPPGFSPSTIRNVSEAKIRQLARRTKVPEDWLLTGKLLQPTTERCGPVTAFFDEYGGYPDFLEPYVQLERDASALINLVTWYSGYSGIPSRILRNRDLSPSDFCQIAYFIAVKMKECEPGFLACKREQEEYRKGSRKEWSWESSVDPFYKIRPGGEREHIGLAISNLPNLAVMAPIVQNAEKSYEHRLHHLEITREELGWLISGFCEAVLTPAQDQPESASPWIKEFRNNPDAIERMRALHQKLFTVYDCEPLPSIHGNRARPGAGRRRKS